MEFCQSYALETWFCCNLGQSNYARHLLSHLLDLLNGKPTEIITPTRGIRQGDPLSPYIFILCAEALFSLISRAIDTNMVQGLKMSPTAPVLHHGGLPYIRRLPPASTHPGNECTRPPPALDQTRNHPDSPLASSARTAASNPLPCTTPAASAPSLLRPWTRPPPASTCVVWAEVDRTHLGWITPLAWVSLLIF
ncbi:hypothetical protein ACLB2K_046268 [Fragaria x ananassa]